MKEIMSEDTASAEVSPNKKISRRDFLKIVGLSAGGAILAGCRPETPEFESLATKGELTPSISKEGEIPFQLSSKEAPIQMSPKWFPDTKTSYIKEGNKLVVYGAAGSDGGVKMEGKSLLDLGKAQYVIAPNNEQTQLGARGYKAFGSVFRGRKDNERIGIYHEEFWPEHPKHFPFNSQIGLAISKDKGFTWEDKGTIISGDFVDPTVDRVTGAGQPTALVSGEKKGVIVNLYYTNWGEIGDAKVCLATAPLNEVENPSAWKKYYDGKFKTEGLGGKSSPVLESSTGAVALASVTWDTKLNKFLAVFERGWEEDAGFYIATSNNGLEWSYHQKIADFPQPHSARSKGDVWYSYPTLISETGNQFITNGEGVLLCSRGVWDESPHKGVVIPFKIS